IEIEAVAPGIVCSVLTVDEQGLLHPLSAPSLPKDYCDALDGLATGPEVGSCGTAAWLGEAVTASCIANDPRWADYKD
ncbi:hypothetical protein ABTJ92_23060, partial [Acinetobacter baumannii]